MSEGLVSRRGVLLGMGALAATGAHAQDGRDNFGGGGLCTPPFDLDGPTSDVWENSYAGYQKLRALKSGVTLIGAGGALAGGGIAAALADGAAPGVGDAVGVILAAAGAVTAWFGTLGIELAKDPPKFEWQQQVVPVLVPLDSAVSLSELAPDLLVAVQRGFDQCSRLAALIDAHEYGQGAAQYGDDFWANVHRETAVTLAAQLRAENLGLLELLEIASHEASVSKEELPADIEDIVVHPQDDERSAWLRDLWSEFTELSSATGRRLPSLDDTLATQDSGYPAELLHEAEKGARKAVSTLRPWGTMSSPYGDPRCDNVGGVHAPASPASGAEVQGPGNGHVGGGHAQGNSNEDGGHGQGNGNGHGGVGGPPTP